MWAANDDLDEFDATSTSSMRPRRIRCNLDEFDDDLDEFDDEFDATSTSSMTSTYVFDDECVDDFELSSGVNDECVRLVGL